MNIVYTNFILDAWHHVSRGALILRFAGTSSSQVIDNSITTFNIIEHIAPTHLTTLSFGHIAPNRRCKLSLWAHCSNHWAHCSHSPDYTLLWAYCSQSTVRIIALSTLLQSLSTLLPLTWLHSPLSTLLPNEGANYCSEHIATIILIKHIVCNHYFKLRLTVYTNNRYSIPTSFLLSTLLLLFDLYIEIITLH